MHVHAVLRINVGNPLAVSDYDDKESDEDVKPVPRKSVAVAALAQLLIPHLNLHVTKPGSRRSADSHVRRHTQQMCAKRHT